MSKRLNVLSSLVAGGLVAMALSACGGGGGGGGGGGTPAVPTLLSIAVTPANPSVVHGVPGIATQFAATGTYSDASTRSVTATATWSSSTTSVATISNAAGSAGLATALAVGSTAISATSGAISGSTTLSVTAPLITATYTFYSLTSSTPQTATLNSNRTLTMGALTLTNFTFGGSATDASGTLTSWASPWNGSNQPVVQAMLFCGSNGKLAYVLLLSDADDPARSASTALDLVNSIAAAPQYDGMSIYTDCSGWAASAWNNNRPSTNFYLWPDTFTTYSAASVMSQLTDAVIFHEAGTPSNQHNYLAITWKGASPFEVWQ